MGGFGSGRHGGKNTTSDLHALDIRRINRDGLLKQGLSVNWTWSRNGRQIAAINMRVGVDTVTLIYTHSTSKGERREMNYQVRVDQTTCNYGGRRAWWLCPAAGCGRRVAVLFGGAIFACRHCHKLAYGSQRETPDDRASRRADKLRARLGWEGGILAGSGVKPKGMHWRTFERLQAKHHSDVYAVVANHASKLSLLPAERRRLRKFDATQGL